MLYIGCDIGFTGAIAILQDLDLIELVDMPVVKVGKANTYDVDAIANILRPFANKATIAIEKAGLRPGQGLASQAKPVKCEGYFHGMASAYQMSPIIVTPQKWQKHYAAFKKCEDRKAIKTKSREIATTVFKRPALFKRVKDDGRADASLIALWLAQQTRGMGE